MIGNVRNGLCGSDGSLFLAVLSLENCVAGWRKRTVCGKRRLIRVCKIRNTYSLVRNAWGGRQSCGSRYCVKILYNTCYLLTYLRTYLLIYVLIYLLICLFTYLLIYVLTYLRTYLFTYLFTYLITYLLTI